MKRLSKKLIALVMAMTMVLAMGVTSFASENTTTDTCTVTFVMNKVEGSTTTPLAIKRNVTVESGTTVKAAVESKLSEYSPQFIDVNDSNGNYSYSYLNAMTIGDILYASTGVSTPSVEGDWTHGHYEGWDWAYYVDGVYAEEYMSSTTITSNCTITLSYTYSSFDW